MKVKKNELVEKITELKAVSNSPSLKQGDIVAYKRFSANWTQQNDYVNIEKSSVECEVLSVNNKKQTAKIKEIKDSEIKNDVPIKYLFKRS